MNRCCEKAFFQRGETARGAKPHGGCAQGSPQSAVSGGASAAGFAGWQRREMAHHQFQAGRPCPAPNGHSVGFTLEQFSEVLKISDVAGNSGQSPYHPRSSQPVEP